MQRGFDATCLRRLGVFQRLCNVESGVAALYKRGKMDREFRGADLETGMGTDWHGRAGGTGADRKASRWNQHGGKNVAGETPATATGTDRATQNRGGTTVMEWRRGQGVLSAGEKSLAGGCQTDITARQKPGRTVFARLDRGGARERGDREYRTSFIACQHERNQKQRE
jgi:hypothetical protein